MAESAGIGGIFKLVLVIVFASILVPIALLQMSPMTNASHESYIGAQGASVLGVVGVLLALGILTLVIVWVWGMAKKVG